MIFERAYRVSTFGPPVSDMICWVPSSLTPRKSSKFYQILDIFPAILPLGQALTQDATCSRLFRKKYIVWHPRAHSSADSAIAQQSPLYRLPPAQNPGAAYPQVIRHSIIPLEGHTMMINAFQICFHPYLIVVKLSLPCSKNKEIEKQGQYHGAG